VVEVGMEVMEVGGMAPTGEIKQLSKPPPKPKTQISIIAIGPSLNQSNMPEYTRTLCVSCGYVGVRS